MKHEVAKKTKYLCPHCGAILYHEKPDTTLDNYPLVCPECDENFFKCECDDILIVEATIGYRTIDTSGKVEYHGGQTDNGVCYKDLNAWKTGKLMRCQMKTSSRNLSRNSMGMTSCQRETMRR